MNITTEQAIEIIERKISKIKAFEAEFIERIQKAGAAQTIERAGERMVQESHEEHYLTKLAGHFKSNEEGAVQKFIEHLRERVLGGSMYVRSTDAFVNHSAVLNVQAITEVLRLAKDIGVEA